MKTSIGASVFVYPTEIRHDVTNGNPTLTFGLWPDVRRLDLHIRDVATIDKMIAELVALKQEMDPPVITDSERTCPAVNDGWHCHRSGDHGVHEDDNGDTWRTDGAPSGAQDTAPLCGYCDNEPATVTLTNGKFCEACAPGVQMVTGAEVTGAQGTAAEMAQAAS